MEGILKVTPEKLISASEQFAGTGQQMSNLTQEMMNLVQSLKGVWQGEASVAYGNKFSSLQTDMDKLYRMVQEHSMDLNEMAQGYLEAENANMETGNSLNTNVVM